MSCHHQQACSYFNQVMQRQFVSSGRVQYFPSCEYKGNGEFVSLLSNEKYSVSYKKEVDSTYMTVVVPSKRPSPFSIEGDARCVPLNELPVLGQRYNDFVLVGAGKTAIDAALFLHKRRSPETPMGYAARFLILDRAHPTHVDSLGKLFSIKLFQALNQGYR